MRKPLESNESVWKAAEVMPTSRRAVAASILAMSCVALGFIGGRLSTLLVPPKLTTQVTRAPLPIPLPATASRPDIATPAVAERAADLPVRSPNDLPSVAIINAGNAEGNLPKNPPGQADRTIEEPRAAVQALLGPQKRSTTRGAPADQNRARDYSDLRRQMLSR